MYSLDKLQAHFTNRTFINLQETVLQANVAVLGVLPKGRKKLRKQLLTLKQLKMELQNLQITFMKT